jgi:hypothetical protein
MFIGHLALGFAAKRAAPRVSLAVLFSAAQLADILAGLRRSASSRSACRASPRSRRSIRQLPYSHSLVFDQVGRGVRLAYRWLTGNRQAVGILARWSSAVGAGLRHPAGMRLRAVRNSASRCGTRFGHNRGRSVICRRGSGCICGPGARPHRPLGASRGRVPIVDIWRIAAPPSIPVLYISALIANHHLTAWAWWADRHRGGRKSAMIRASIHTNLIARAIRALRPPFGIRRVRVPPNATLRAESRLRG